MDAHPDKSTLVQVLLEARALLARPRNDFAWSSWEDESAALAEIDSLIVRIRAGDFVRSELAVLFAPTGPIQEVSINSGWSAEFLTLADAYDRAFRGE